MDAAYDAGAVDDVSLPVQLDAFVQALSRLQAHLEARVQDNARASSSVLQQSAAALDATTVNQLLLQLQRQFQAILSTADSMDADPELSLGQAFASYQTEAHRRLRLMTVEAMRLRTARQPQTVKRICDQLNAHLAQIQQFAQAMLDEVSG